MKGISMVERFSLNVSDSNEFPRYVKSTKKVKKDKTNHLSPNDKVTILEKKIESLELKVTALTMLFEKQSKSFDEFLGALRRAQLQDVRAKEKAYNMIGSNNLQGGLKMFMDESRRSDLQMVSYSSRRIGMDYKPTKYKYGEKAYNVKK
jgi:hypothetical protein